MIKFCIALALLATITLAADCEVNKLLAARGATITACKCDLSQNDDDLLGSMINKYCQKKWTASAFVQSIQDAPTSATCNAGKATGEFTRFTTDCVIGGATAAGTKICSNANVYVAALVSSSCPLIEVCVADTVIDGTTAPCLCGGTNRADVAGDVDLKEASKYCKTGASSAFSVVAAPAPCTTAQKKGFTTAIVTGGCQCTTNNVCAAAKYCYDGACNDAAKLCSTMTAEECDGLDRTAATCPDTVGCDKTTCCEGFKVSSAFTMGVQTAVIVGLMTFM